MNPQALEGASGVAGLLTSAAGGITEQINAALPIAGPVFALVAGIFVGLKIFKRVTGAKA